jgi:hypothetical protein
MKAKAIFQFNSVKWHKIQLNKYLFNCLSTFISNCVSHESGEDPVSQTGEQRDSFFRGTLKKLSVL